MRRLYNNRSEDANYFGKDSAVFRFTERSPAECSQIE